MDLINSGGYAIEVSGNDVYVAGFVAVANSNDVVTYWKNNAPVALSSEQNYQHGYYIRVSGNDIYVTGDWHCSGSHFFMEKRNVGCSF